MDYSFCVNYKLLYLRVLTLLFGFISLSINISQAQKIITTNEQCTDQNIKSILLYRSGNDLNLPVINFEEDEKLTFRFDYIGEYEEDFYYSVKACSYDWEPTENPDYLYLDGFNNNLVENKYSSFNTWKYYEHYMTELPSEDLKFLSSGNYILNVYDNSNPEKIIITRRFCIAEPKLSIKAKVKHPDHQNQELQLEIDISKLKLTNPLADIKIVVIKNNDWNNQLDLAFKPVLRDNILYLDLPYQLITGGGNEFRYFDIKSIKYISDRMDSIRYISPETHFYLKPDILRQFTPYFTSADLNGMFYIDMSDAYDRHIESEYVSVHFTLESPETFSSEVYIYGALTDWKTDNRNIMNYNSRKRVYEKTLILKQGYYNYCYVIKDNANKHVLFEQTEGNHSETENEYAVFVYLSESMSDYDRLVGFQIISSTGEIKEIILNP